MENKEIKKLYAKKDKMHNWNHILRLRKDVDILKKPYKDVNEDLLEFLIRFHGLKEYVTKNKTKFSKKYVDSLIRHNNSPKLIEEKLVFDANMLDNVGKQGIKKALAYGKQINRNKEDTFRYLKTNINKARFYTKLGKQLGNKQIRIMKEIIRWD